MTGGKKRRSSEAEAEEALRPARGQGAQTVHDSLRRAILDLSLPPGSPLDEVSLAAEFDMSRTPVREALLRLAAEGLVTTLPNRSTIVTPIDLTRLPVYFEALALMYRVTTRSAAAHRTEADLAPIRALAARYADAVRRHDALAMIEANRNFHVAIAEAGGNPYFTGLFTRLLDEGRRLLRLYYSSFDDHLPRQYVEEHEAMVAAIEARDPDGADRLAAAHAAQIVRQIQSYMARDTAASVELAER